ncbi:MAG TPA: HlyD family secretion protein [Xanthobacteraceae bacterium]|nr:HlyD family secretion protein [Xanthobacteraceae bacterium]
MADTVLKFSPQRDSATARRRRALTGFLRARLRMILLVLGPAAALLIGLGFYLSGGRYISTDNAYVGAQKVLITPDISGKVSRVLVREGEHVAAGDALFEIDPVPFRLALQGAQSKLDAVRTQFANLKSNYTSLKQLVEFGQQGVALKQRDVDRKATLVESRTGSQADLDTAKSTLLTAELQLQLGRQQLGSTLNQLLGNADLAIEDFPPYQEAKAALDQAQRNLDHTVLKAPIAGTATQVDNIQLGRFVTAGTPVFSVIDDAAPWVDANPKETDITWLRAQQKVDISVDSFPNRTFHGTVASVSPGTGAQFAILPPQNANGNWVKVVQRVPVRIVFDQGQDLSLLRAGMSVTVDIDTGRRRSLTSLFGARPSAAQEAPRADAKRAQP